MPDKKIYKLNMLLAFQTSAMNALSTEKVQHVTFNTIIFDPLIHPSIQRHEDYDQKTHLSICIHIIKDEAC